MATNTLYSNADDAFRQKPEAVFFAYSVVRERE